jgi:hydrogenase maturation protease
MKILLIGIGNAFRGDDAVGLHVARLVAERRLAGVTVTEESGEGVALLERWKDAEEVIVVDAVASGAAPGTIHRFAAHTQKLPAKTFASSASFQRSSNATPSPLSSVTVTPARRRSATSRAT